MKRSFCSVNQTILALGLVTLFVCLGVHPSQAAGKHRGYVDSVDVETKTLVISKERIGQKVSVKWDDQTTIDKGTIADLKKGQWVRCIMRDETIIDLIRRFPEKDKGAGEEEKDDGDSGGYN